MFFRRPPLLVLNKQYVGLFGLPFGRILITATSSFGMDYNIVFARYGAAWRHSRRIFEAHLGPAELEAYRPLEEQAVHRLLRSLLSSPDNFVQHLRQ